MNRYTDSSFLQQEETEGTQLLFYSALIAWLYLDDGCGAIPSFKDAF